jgi:DNA polymerase III delta prime subunit
MNDDLLWVEKYRPHTVDECILPDRLKTPFKAYAVDKEVPNMLLSGGPGVGKTTIARALCEEIGANRLLIPSSEERGVDTIRTKIRGYASTISMTGGKKVIILDEADGITPDAQNALRGSIEEFSKNCSFILTCNFKAKILDAIHSRMVVIDFKLEASERPLMAKLFFKRLEEILGKEGVNYDKAVLAKIIEKYFPDYRRILGELQHLTKFGDINAGVLSQISDIRKLKELFPILKDKNFTEMRKWVVANNDIEPTIVFRKIYDALEGNLQPHSIPQAVVIISKYQYQAAFVADQEVNLVAMLTEIMIECEFN